MFRRLLPLFCAAVVGAAPLSAQTVLLVVQESVDDKPLPPPLASKEGAGNSLFDAGYIVLELPDSQVEPDRDVLAQTARSAGADLIVTLKVRYTETAVGSRLTRRSAGAAWAVVYAKDGAVRATGTQEASNKDREADIDRRALGKELGARVAKKVVEALGASASAP